jgi:hypothetical protein
MPVPATPRARGLTKLADADAQGHVPDRALEDLDFMLCDEQARTRRDPAAAAGSAVKKACRGRSDDAECAQVRPLGIVETQLEQHLVGMLPEQRRRPPHLDRCCRQLHRAGHQAQ